MRLPSLSLVLLALCLSSTAPLVISQEQNRIDQVRDLLRQASKLIADMPEEQRMSAASNIANTQARAGDISGALATVHSLKNPREQAQALGFVAIAMDYSGNSADALALISNSANGQGKNDSYAMIAAAHADKGDFSGALRIANLIQAEPVRLVETLIMIATAEWKSGDHAGAQRTWDEALDVAKHSGNANTVLLSIDIATSHAEVGEISAATTALEDVYSTIEEGKPPDSGLLSALAMGFAHIGDITSALRVIKELPPGTNRDISIMQVSMQLMKVDDVANATENASRIADPQLRATALQEIAISQAASGNSASAVDTTDKIPTPSGHSEALATLALQQAEKGDAAASDTLRRASTLADNAAGTVPLYVFEAIAVTRAMLGDFAAAQADVQKLPPEARTWPWTNITSMMVEAGDLNGALEIAANETSAQPKASALLGTAKALLHQIHEEAKDPSASQ
jgi:hypothetical protein